MWGSVPAPARACHLLSLPLFIGRLVWGCKFIRCGKITWKPRAGGDKRAHSISIKTGLGSRCGCRWSVQLPRRFLARIPDGGYSLTKVTSTSFQSLHPPHFNFCPHHSDDAILLPSPITCVAASQDIFLKTGVGSIRDCPRAEFRGVYMCRLLGISRHTDGETQERLLEVGSWAIVGCWARLPVCRGVFNRCIRHQASRSIRVQHEDIGGMEHTRNWGVGVGLPAKTWRTDMSSLKRAEVLQ